MLEPPSRWYSPLLLVLAEIFHETRIIALYQILFSLIVIGAFHEPLEPEVLALGFSGLSSLMTRWLGRYM